MSRIHPTVEKIQLHHTQLKGCKEESRYLHVVAKPIVSYVKMQINQRIHLLSYLCKNVVNLLESDCIISE